MKNTYKIEYTHNALKDLSKIDPKIAIRIVRKINHFTSQENIFDYATPLIGLSPNQYRFRIGDYRAIFRITPQGEIQLLIILKIKHRKDIYKIYQ